MSQPLTNYRYANKTGDHSIIDGFIDIRVREFLYKGGEGKMVTVPELVKIRNKVTTASCLIRRESTSAKKCHALRFCSEERKGKIGSKCSG